MNCRRAQREGGSLAGAKSGCSRSPDQAPLTPREPIVPAAWKIWSHFQQERFPSRTHSAMAALRRTWLLRDFLPPVKLCGNQVKASLSSRCSVPRTCPPRHRGASLQNSRCARSRRHRRHLPQQPHGGQTNSPPLQPQPGPSAAHDARAYRPCSLEDLEPLPTRTLSIPHPFSGGSAPTDLAPARLTPSRWARRQFSVNVDVESGGNSPVISTRKRKISDLSDVKEDCDGFVVREEALTILLDVGQVAYLALARRYYW